MSGHYRDNYGYIDCVESLDSELLPLYNLCKENNLAFILTADHGMAFSADGSKGGHQSEKYSVSDEAQMVPFIANAQDIESGVIRGSSGRRILLLHCSGYSTSLTGPGLSRRADPAYRARKPES